MRALSVSPPSARAPRVLRSQVPQVTSRKDVCVRRGQSLVVRAAEKTVGPEPPAAADAKSGDESAATEAEEVPAEVGTVEKIAQLLKDNGAGDLEKDVMELVGQLEGDVEQANTAYKQGDEQLRQLKDQYRRLQADFDNFRSRADQEKSKSGAAAKARVLEQLLPVIDNFEIAGKSIKTETEAEQKINDSYQNLYRQTVEIFRNLGLEAVPTVGTPFDPEMHDGVMREENDDVPDGEVLEEFRKGFKYKDELLRPAMVKVAVSTAPPPPAEGAEDDKADKSE